VCVISVTCELRVESDFQDIWLYLCIKALVLEYLLSQSDLGQISEIITVIN
jgi:hypothetical protein